MLVEQAPRLVTSVGRFHLDSSAGMCQIGKRRLTGLGEVEQNVHWAFVQKGVSATDLSEIGPHDNVRLTPAREGYFLR